MGNAKHMLDKSRYGMEKNAQANSRIHRFWCMRGLEHFDKPTKELCMMMHRRDTRHAVLKTLASDATKGRFLFLCQHFGERVYAEIVRARGGCSKLAMPKINRTPME
jgi:hypothetical protein